MSAPKKTAKRPTLTIGQRLDFIEEALGDMQQGLWFGEDIKRALREVKKVRAELVKGGA